MKKKGGGEGEGAEDDRRIDDGVPRRGQPEHPEDDREPRRHRREQRPGDRVVSNFRSQIASEGAELPDIGRSNTSEHLFRELEIEVMMAPMDARPFPCPPKFPI